MLADGFWEFEKSPLRMFIDILSHLPLGTKYSAQTCQQDVCYMLED